MNGNAYTMFDQILRTWERSLSSMQAGLGEYAAHLQALEYPHDFLYLTTTNPPEAWDNSPPNPWVAGLIREWNEKVKDPLIRYVTPEELLARLRRIPPSLLPQLDGDWTDYWSFGNGASAYETAISRQARFSLEAAEMLQASRRDAPGASRAARQPRGVGEAFPVLRAYVDLLGPGSRKPADTGAVPAQGGVRSRVTRAGRIPPHRPAGDPCREPSQSARPGQLLIVNPSSRARSVNVRLPAAWLAPGKRLRVQRFAWTSQREGREKGSAYGPVEVPPFGWKRIPIAGLAPAKTSSLVRIDEHGTEAVIRSPFHTLRCDTATGRILGLRDEILGWDVLAPEAQQGEPSFFEPCGAAGPWRRWKPQCHLRARPWKEKLDTDCWKTDWKAERQGPARLVSCTASRDEDSVSLVRELSVPGLDLVRQRITLSAETDAIELEATLYKQDHAAPEALYFAFPLNLPAGWRGDFDSAGVPLELDAEQLPESCRGWMSVDTFAALHAGALCATLVCRDSTLVQPSGFSFGRVSARAPARSAAPPCVAAQQLLEHELPSLSARDHPAHMGIPDIRSIRSRGRDDQGARVPAASDCAPCRGRSRRGEPAPRGRPRCSGESRETGRRTATAFSSGSSTSVTETALRGSVPAASACDPRGSAAPWRTTGRRSRLSMAWRRSPFRPGS